jgi:hypothetical protein
MEGHQRPAIQGKVNRDSTGQTKTGIVTNEEKRESGVTGHCYDF